MKRIILLSINLLIATLLIFTSYNCNEPSYPKATVEVVGEDGEPVEEAVVIIKSPSADSAHTMIYFPDYSKHIADTQLTDRDGIIEYTFKYEAIYKVEVIKSKDRDYPFTRRGRGVLILEHDKTYKEKITINEQTIL
jgi:hypothetical protein